MWIIDFFFFRLIKDRIVHTTDILKIIFNRNNAVIELQNSSFVTKLQDCK